MAKIWANRLIGGTKSWAEVPDFRKPAVKAELLARVNSGEITQEQYIAIIGLENV